MNGKLMGAMDDSITKLEAHSLVARTDDPERTGEPVSQTEKGFIRYASVDDLANLPHLAGPIPREAWLVALIGAAQRFSFYGTTVPWQNYLQNPPDDNLVPGALGLGQSKATTINNVFLFFSFTTPSLFAIFSDSRLGRYKTFLLSLILFTVGNTVLFITSLPFAVNHEKVVLGGFVAALVLTGLGQGGTTAVMFSFLGDQIPSHQPRVVSDANGGLSVVHHQVTIQHCFNVFYWMINIASLSTLATTILEKKVGFWAAYLLPLVVIIAACVLFMLWGPRFKKVKSQENVLSNTVKIMILASRSGFHLGAASPASDQSDGHQPVPWTSEFVLELRRGLKACRVLLFFILFYLCFNQSTNNIISQANEMQSGGVSNDTLQSLNAIFYIFLNPLIQLWGTPFLARRRITFGPISRMATAFILMAMSVGYAAIIQKLIYSRGPCFSAPRACEAAITTTSGGETEYRPNEISVWLQTPFHFFVASAEIFGFVALNEFTYTEAPTDMKALVKAFEQFTAALGSALGIALAPVSKDPWLVIFYAVLAGATGLLAVVLYWVFREYDVIWHSKRDNEEKDGLSGDPIATAGDA